MQNRLIKTSVILVLILLAAFSRLIPHPPNFTAIGAMAVFAGMAAGSLPLALILPLASMWISDLVLNNFVYESSEFVWFTSGGLWIYIGILSHSLIARLFKSPSVKNVSAVSFAGALSFYLISNFGVWFQSGMYPKTSEGLAACYIAALPFLGNFIAGNLVFSAILFSIYYLMEKRMQSFQTI